MPQICKHSESEHFQLFRSVQKLRFRDLSNEDKIACTTISNQQFITPFLQLIRSHQYNPLNLHHLPSLKTIPPLDRQNSTHKFFNAMLQFFRVAILGSPVLYLSSVELMDERMLVWMNAVSEDKIFEHAHRVSDREQPEENWLWFNRSSFHRLEEWFLSELQIVIVGNFYRKRQESFSGRYQYLHQFKKHMKKAHKTQDICWLELSLGELNSKGEAQINAARERIKIQEEKYTDMVRQSIDKICQELQTKDIPKKKNKKKGKKKVKDPQNQHKNIKSNAKTKDSSPNSQKADTPSKDSSNEKQIEQNERNENEHQQLEFQPTLQPQTPTNQNPLQIEQEQTPIILNSPDSQKQPSSLSPNKEHSRSRSRNLIYVSPKRSFSPPHDTTHFKKEREEQEQKQMEFVMKRERISSKTEDQRSSECRHSTDFRGEYNEFEDGQQEASDSQNQDLISPIIRKKKHRSKRQKQPAIYKQLRKTLLTRLLNKQLTSFIDTLSIETNSYYQMKIIAFQRVRFFSQCMFPGCQAILFGSNAIGMSLPNSDVDIMIGNLPCSSREQASEYLAQLAVEINAMGWIVSCSTYLNAKVPLVKLQIDPSINYLKTKRKGDYYPLFQINSLSFLELPNPSPPHTIKIDITFSLEGLTSLGYQSTELMRSWLTSRPYLQRLLLMLKYILAEKGYNQNFRGGIGSYCLFVMVAAYLKEFGGEVEVGQEGQLFLDILHFYGEVFQNSTNVIALSQEGTCFLPMSSIEHLMSEQSSNIKPKQSLLKILDPISNRIMSSSCYEYPNIRHQFRRIRSEIAEIQGLIQEEFTEVRLTAIEAGKMMNTKKSIDKWVSKFQAKRGLNLIREIIDGKK